MLSKLNALNHCKSTFVRTLLHASSKLTAIKSLHLKPRKIS